MKRMRMSFLHFRKRDYHVLINGREQTLIRVGAWHELTLTTDAEQVEVIIYNTLPLRSPLWFVYSALLYLISCFGLFDFTQWRDAIFSYCRMIVPVMDGELLTFAPAPRRKNGLAFQITGNIPLRLLDNTNYADPICVRRKWILRILRCLCAIAAFVMAVIIIVLLIV